MNKVLVFIMIMLHPVLSFAVSVEMTVDRTQLAVGETLSMQIKVTGSKSPSDPQINGLDAFQVLSSGSGSQVQIINGNVTSSKTFQYQLSPLRPGNFTIGPATVTIDGAQHHSAPATITVSRDSAQAPADREAGLKLELSTTSPYVHGQVLCTLRFESRVPMTNAELAQPDFAGFWKEQLGDATQYQRVINGQQWVVNEIKWALFPTRAGTVTIPPVRIAADVIKPGQRLSGLMAFQDTERRVFTSPPVTLQVKDLPAEGRPSNFSGLVGKFAVQEKISQNEVKVGDSVTLTITVSGSGNVRDIQSPAVSALQDFKIYDDEPKVNVQAGANGITGTKTFTKAIVPLKAGELTIPAFELSYFDPDDGQYKSISTQAIKLTVSPSDQPQSSSGSIALPNGGAKKDVAVVGRDVMPITVDASLMANDGVTPGERRFFSLMVLLPALLAGAAWGLYRRLLRIRSDSGFLRRNQARRSATRMIEKLAHSTDANFCQDASLILRNYIGDKFNVDGRALTPIDIEKLFAELSLPEGKTSMVKSLLSIFNEATYGGRTIDANERKRLTDVLARTIESIERGADR